MRLILTYFCLRQHFSGCQNLSFRIDVSKTGLLNKMLGLICRPDGFAGWLLPQATTSNHIQMYHRGTRRINISKKIRRINNFKNQKINVEVCHLEAHNLFKNTYKTCKKDT